MPSRDSLSFCSVVRLEDRVYVFSEADADGPRRLKLPPRKLKIDRLDVELGLAIQKALDEYESDGRPIPADEWNELNDRLLELVGEKSVSAYERKKRGLTVRHDEGRSEVTLYAKSGEVVASLNPIDWPKAVSIIRRKLRL